MSHESVGVSHDDTPTAPRPTTTLRCLKATLPTDWPGQPPSRPAIDAGRLGAVADDGFHRPFHRQAPAFFDGAA